VFKLVEASMLPAVDLLVAVFMPTTNNLLSLRIVGHLDLALGAVMIVVLVEGTQEIFAGRKYTKTDIGLLKSAANISLICMQVVSSCPRYIIMRNGSRYAV
jgi:hypothetical protein